MNEVFGIIINSENDIELLTGIINLYCLAKQLKLGDDKKLRNKLIVLLSYYVKYGYSKDTKNLAAESLNTTHLNINTMNSELTKKGYLLVDSMNHHKKYLNKELEQLRNYYLKDNKVKILAVAFTNE